MCAPSLRISFFRRKLDPPQPNDHSLLAVHVLRDGFELLQGGAEVFDDFGGDDGGVGEVVGVLQRLVLEPEDV